MRDVHVNLPNNHFVDIEAAAVTVFIRHYITGMFEAGMPAGKIGQRINHATPEFFQLVEGSGKSFGHHLLGIQEIEKPRERQSQGEEKKSS